jgi:hypothetical protein
MVYSEPSEVRQNASDPLGPLSTLAELLKYKTDYNRHKKEVINCTKYKNKTFQNLL